MTQKSPTRVDLTKLLEGPGTREQVGATRYAIQQTVKEGLIEQTDRPKGAARGLHYRLTRKGKERARRAAKKNGGTEKK